MSGVVGVRSDQGKFHAFHYNSLIDSEFCDVFGVESVAVTFISPVREFRRRP